MKNMTNVNSDISSFLSRQESLDNEDFLYGSWMAESNKLSKVDTSEFTERDPTDKVEYTDLSVVNLEDHNNHMQDEIDASSSDEEWKIYTLQAPEAEEDIQTYHYFDNHADIQYLETSNDGEITVDFRETSLNIKHDKQDEHKEIIPDISCPPEIPSEIEENKPRKRMRVKKEFWPCSKCTFITKFKYSLTRHIERTHMKPAVIYQCTRCPYKTKSKENLTIHFRRHHKNKTKHPQGKIKDAIYKITNLNHARENGTYSCRKCSYKTTRNIFLEAHCKRVHGEPDEVYNCPECEHQASSVQDLLSHCIKVHKKSSKVCQQYLKSEETLESRSEETTGIHQCPMCPFSTTFITGLRRHMTRIHFKSKNNKPRIVENNSKPRIVENNSKPIKNNHRSVSSEPNKCSECPYESSNLDNLRKHRLYNHGSKNGKYQCSDCSFKTNFEHYLEMHCKRVHEKTITTYKCKDCVYQTNVRRYLDLHVKKKHSAVKVKCRKN